MERIKDYLLMEEEFIKNQERLKPQEEKQEVSQPSYFAFSYVIICAWVNVSAAIPFVCIGLRL